MSKAATMTGVSLSTIKRKRVAGEFPNAVQDDHGTWLLPVEDLLAAGLHLNSVAPVKHSVSGVSAVGQHRLTQTSDLDPEPDSDEPTADLRRLLEVSELRRLVAEAERDGLRATAEALRATAEAERKRADGLDYVIRHQLMSASATMTAGTAPAPAPVPPAPTSAPSPVAVDVPLRVPVVEVPVPVPPATSTTQVHDDDQGGGVQGDGEHQGAPVADLPVEGVPVPVEVPVPSRVPAVTPGPADTAPRGRPGFWARLFGGSR